MRDRMLMAAAAGLLGAAAAGPGALGARTSVPSPPEAVAVGAEACASCHTRVHAEWTAGRHSRMVQPATPQAVRGDFSRGKVTLRGRSYGLRRAGDAFFVTESDITGSPVERRASHTLGNRRVQHYLARLPDGRIVVLPPSWDILRREWFHNLDIVDPEELTSLRVQVWNTNCFGCHVSEQVKGYDPVRREYDTRWMDSGTSCERCHGPGSRHVEARRAQAEEVPGEIVRPLTLPADRQTMICAQCHSLRDVVSPGYLAGADYFDHYMPILEYAQKGGADPAWWADGRPRRFSNDALGFWQSACFLKGGATCLSCHESAHRPDADGPRAPEGGGNAACLSCHAAIGRDVAKHTHHRADGPGSSCVGCHMPKTVFSLRGSAMRDHTLSVPAPENTGRFRIPNACGTCHEGRSARWATEAMKGWGPSEARERQITRAEAFTGGREGRKEALPGLMAIAADQEESFLTRANAIGHLRKYKAPPAVRAATSALRDEHPLVRAVAALTLAELRAEATVELVRAAGDPARIVRVAAAFALVGAGVTRLPGADGDRLEQAKREYVARAALLTDDARTQLEVGKFHLLDRRADEAAVALQAARALDPGQPGTAYLLGMARLAQGRTAEGRALLSSVPPRDPFHSRARALLRRLE